MDNCNLMDEQLMKQCTAKSKQSGKQCRRTPSPGSDKCVMHGGRTPKGIASPHFKDGKQSKYQYLPKNFSARLESVVSDHIENIEHSIEIQKLLETTYLEKLGTTESTEAWAKLKSAVKDYDNAEFTAKNDGEKALAQAQAFGMIRFIVNEGLSQSFLYRDIQGIQETQRKLSETLSKVRKEAQEIYTHEQWNEMLSVLVQVLKSNITDTSILQAIQNQLYEYSQRQNPKQLNPVG